MDRREFLELLAGFSALVPGLIGERAWAGAHARAQTTPKLRTLDPLQEATVTRVADILVPQTDTVGATDVGVTSFIDLLLTESMLPLQRDRFLVGLAAINARSQERYRAPLPAAKPAEQEALLRALDAQLPRRNPTPAEARELAHAPVTAERGYAVLKALVLLGYFTAAPVAKKLLITAPIIPGRYDGCIPV
jgi:Gluconate 2-dehydrogenase subunit 3